MHFDLVLGHDKEKGFKIVLKEKQRSDNKNLSIFLIYTCIYPFQNGFQETYIKTCNSNRLKKKEKVVIRTRVNKGR